jgi:hypothetical protein
MLSRGPLPRLSPRKRGEGDRLAAPNAIATPTGEGASRPKLAPRDKPGHDAMTLEKCSPGPRHAVASPDGLAADRRLNEAAMRFALDAPASTLSKKTLKSTPRRGRACLILLSAASPDRPARHNTQQGTQAGPLKPDADQGDAAQKRAVRVRLRRFRGAGEPSRWRRPSLGGRG